MSHKTGVLKEERWSGSFRDEQRHSAFLGPRYKGGREDTPTPGEAAGEAVFAEERLQADVDSCIRAVRGWEGGWGPLPACGSKYSQMCACYLLSCAAHFTHLVSLKPPPSPVSRYTSYSHLITEAAVSEIQGLGYGHTVGGHPSLNQLPGFRAFTLPVVFPRA